MSGPVKPTLKSITLLAIAVLVMNVSQPSAQADSLDAILARMDRGAKEFKSVTTDIRQIEYTAIVKDSTENIGVLRIKRNNKSVIAITEFTKPGARTVLFKDKKVIFYYPKAKEAQEIDLAKYTSIVDQFLLLAFGTSGKDLLKDYDIKPGGAETVGSTATTRLELIPKAADAKKYITKIELWIPEGQSNAIREKVTETSGNYNLADYTNVRVNAPIPDSAFDLKLPKDVKIVHPQH